MPRPKILDVNEGVGEALFYPYNVLLNKCSGSCNTLVYNTKVTSIEVQITGLTKSAVDNLADITKLKAIDTSSFVTRTKFSADTNALDDKIDGVEKKNRYKWISY